MPRHRHGCFKPDVQQRLQWWLLWRPTLLLLCCCCISSSTIMIATATEMIDIVVGLNELVETVHDNGIEPIVSLTTRLANNNSTVTAAAEVTMSSSMASLEEEPESIKLQALAQKYGATVLKLGRSRAAKLRVNKSMLEQLSKEPGVDYWERDNLVYPMWKAGSAATGTGSSGGSGDAGSGTAFSWSLTLEEEEVPWGLTAIGAESSHIPAAAPSADSADCFKICVVDGGMLLSHPDLPFTPANAWGKTFGLPEGQTWDQPLFNHGTHVAGIMVAQANNNIGIQGVIPDAQNICMLTARVFDDSGNGALDSDIFEAVNWCADEGARIINLSLGSPRSGTATAKEIYQRIHEEGVLVVSASGNGYDDRKYNYPASFPQVVSVAAVDHTLQRANFSTYNDEVNVAAPGVSIRSTVPMRGVKNDQGHKYELHALEHSLIPKNSLERELVECGELKSDFDCNPQGKICLIKRGSVPFLDKAKLCQRLGGVGAIIYNDRAGVFSGTLGKQGIVRIPVVGVLQADGLALLASTKATISFVHPGYTEISGTSMSTPFAAGLAARIWSTRPECTNEQVKDALYSSAKSLGTEGSDRLFFGNGLIQAQAAYNALLAMPAPCGGDGEKKKSSTTYVVSPTSGSAWWKSSSWELGDWTWSSKVKHRDDGNRHRYLRRGEKGQQLSIPDEDAADI